jgi:hypothetical protein
MSKEMKSLNVLALITRIVCVRKYHCRSIYIAAVALREIMLILLS